MTSKQYEDLKMYDVVIIDLDSDKGIHKTKAICVDKSDDIVLVEFTPGGIYNGCNFGDIDDVMTRTYKNHTSYKSTTTDKYMEFHHNYLIPTKRKVKVKKTVSNEKYLFPDIKDL